MSTKPLCWLLAAAVILPIPADASLVELAAAGQWERLLQVANRRDEQLPLQPDEALLAAVAARAVGDSESEIRHLRRAAEEGRFAEVARLELAAALASREPAEALALAVPMLRGASTAAMREGAVEVAVEAMTAAAVPFDTSAVERSLRALPVEARRPLELALAQIDPSRSRGRLVRLLEASTNDQTGLSAARSLQAAGELTPFERWLVADSLYRHALYDEAIPLLVGLDGADDRRVPSLEVAFIAARCAFRQGRWQEAAARFRAADSMTRSSERRADLAVHEARAWELEGRLDAAAEAAVRAVTLRPTDDRRLFLARLRLRLGDVERARLGVSRLEGRTARAKGEMLLALDEVRRGRIEEARRRLGSIRRRPLAGPAAVLAAGLAADGGEPGEALRILEGAAGELDPYWADRARAVMVRLPDALLESWRAGQVEAAATAQGTVRRRVLARWTTLEIDEAVLDGLRAEVGALAGLPTGPLPAPALSGSLAAGLWEVGLRAEAVRWDPRGLPTDTPVAALWTAQQLVDLGEPARGLRAADRAWRLAGADVPFRGYPETLQRALHPLPYPDETWASAVAGAVPWSLVAGVAREESRWDAGVMSAVGARGLMQLMPATAAGVAAAIERPPPSLDELFDPRVSLRLGAAELGRLYRVFGGDLAPMVAAYNAGEPQARIWLDQCGDACTSERFIAGITFGATSGYTRDVLAAAASYEALYGARPGVQQP